MLSVSSCAVLGLSVMSCSFVTVYIRNQRAIAQTLSLANNLQLFPIPAASATAPKPSSSGKKKKVSTKQGPMWTTDGQCVFVDPTTGSPMLQSTGSGSCTPLTMPLVSPFKNDQGTVVSDARTLAWGFYDSAGWTGQDIKFGRDRSRLVTVRSNPDGTVAVVDTSPASYCLVKNNNQLSVAATSSNACLKFSQLPTS